MSRGNGKVHVVRVRKAHVDKQGNPREYSSAYLRRTYREGKRVRNETVANLSALPEHVIDGIDAGLKGAQLVAAGTEFTIARSLPHGHVAAVAAMAHQLGFPALLGPACRSRDLVLALIISRVVRPASCPPWDGGPIAHWALIWMWPAPPPMRSTLRWIGWSAAKTLSKASSPLNILGQK